MKKLIVAVPPRSSAFGAGGYFRCGNASSIVRTFCESNPGLTACRRVKLFISNPAPTNRTNASATSAITNTLRIRFGRAPVVDPRPPSFKASVNSGLALASAGINPNTIPLPIATEAVTSNTLQSSVTSFSRGIVRAPTRFRRSRPHRDNNTPAVPPARASATLSVNIWRNSRDGLAPTATRIASSRSRALARANSMVARFAHATSKTSATAPSKMTRPSRIPPTTCCCNG